MYIIFNCVLYWRTLNLNKALLYLDSSTYFFSMLSVLNLIWAVYVGSWSLEKDGAFLCLYSVSFSIVLLLSKKWITIIVLIDHHVISYLISILIFLEIFLITLSFNINDMQPDIIYLLAIGIERFLFHTWEFSQVRDLK